MKINLTIRLLFLSVLLRSLPAYTQQTGLLSIPFLRDTFEIPYEKQQFVEFGNTLTEENLDLFYREALSKDFEKLAVVLVQYRKKSALDDWFFYQLIRKTAGTISPKVANYTRYTLYKWLLLKLSGYDAMLLASPSRVLLYVRSDETVYNIPIRKQEGKQFICLNYHDYGQIDFNTESFTWLDSSIKSGEGSFSYKLTRIPEGNYQEHEIGFAYSDHLYQFRVQLNQDIKTLFTNYPVVDYEAQFNMPLSEKTRQSLLGSLQAHLKKMKQKEGVDFLMRFTRYAFLFKNDNEIFGTEKRLSPEQTLLYEYSDCEDRAALFFFLVKEIYDLPMLVLTYPEHVTIAIKFDKAYGHAIEYNGEKYSVCEPSPQGIDLNIGQLLPRLSKKPYQIAYSYQPSLR